MNFAWSGIALGALFWIWRRARKRRELERERNRRAKPCRHPNRSGADSLIVNNTKNVELFVRIWTEPSSQGVVLLIHSFAMHSEYFVETATALKLRRYAVVAYDLQGHGLSGTTEKAPADVRRFEHLVSDAVRMMVFIRTQFTRLPLFVIGEGFGATIALHVALRMERNLEGLVLCSPFILPNLDPHPPSYLTPLLFALEKLMPDLRIASEEMGKTMKDTVDTSLIHAPTLRLCIQAHRALRYLARRLSNLNCPFVAMHGKQDTRASPLHSRKLFSSAKSKDKTLMIYESLESCLFAEREEDRSQVLTDILAWLDARTTTPKIEITEPLRRKQKGGFIPIRRGIKLLLRRN